MLNKIKSLKDKHKEKFENQLKEAEQILQSKKESKVADKKKTNGK